MPTLETPDAVEILREHFPELKIRIINVVDLMTLQLKSEYPHRLSHKTMDLILTLVTKTLQVYI